MKCYSLINDIAISETLETENVLLPLWLFRDLVAVDFLANSIETSSKWTVFTDSFRFYRKAKYQ